MESPGWQPWLWLLENLVLLVEHFIIQVGLHDYFLTFLLMKGFIETKDHLQDVVYIYIVVTESILKVIGTREMSGGYFCFKQLLISMCLNLC